MDRALGREAQTIQQRRGSFLPKSKAPDRSEASQPAGTPPSDGVMIYARFREERQASQFKGGRSVLDPYRK